jgi:enoyl-CoA hydratase/carnithine racemase
VPAPDQSSVPIAFDISHGIARVKLQRPPLNVLDLETLRRLNQALREADVSAARVIVLSSNLPRAFSAGVEIRDHVASRLQSMLAEVRENARLLLQTNAVTLAAIHGSTMGGGAELALLCDLVVAADNLTLAFPEIGLAAFPPIASALLPERCPGPAAMRLLLGESIDARTAEDLGLISTIVSADRLNDAAEELSNRIAGYSAVALYALIRSTRGQRTPGILQRLDAAIATYQAIVGPSLDAQEGIDAFLEKRTPAWSHR